MREKFKRNENKINFMPLGRYQYKNQHEKRGEQQTDGQGRTSLKLNFNKYNLQEFQLRIRTSANLTIFAK